MTVLTAAVVCREFLGRSGELAHLLDRLERRTSRPAGVVVRGAAGIGKSRLIEEFAAEARARGARTGIGRAREFANAPYLALEEALHGAGIVAEAPENAAGKMQHFLALAEAIRETATPAAPIALVIEDVHHADGATTELVRFLIRTLAGEPFLCVVTYRTEAVENDFTRAAASHALERECADVLNLRPLPHDVIGRLLGVVLTDLEQQLDVAVRERVADLSDGRPLYAEELLRSVLERGEAGAGEPEIPTTLRASVRERFLALAESDRDILVHAAVIGRRFSASFLARLMGREPRAMFAALRHARDQQLIIEEGDAEGDLFAFRHALTRETIYAELLRAEARALHGRIAHVLGTEDPLDLSVVAEHSWRARDGSEGVWNERAADAALAVHAHADAVIGFERAHSAAVDVLHRASLAERLAESYYAAAHIARGLDWYVASADAYDAGGDAGGALRMRGRAARTAFELSRFDEGLELARASVARAASPQDRHYALVTLAGLLTNAGRPSEAFPHLAAAAALPFTPTPQLRALYEGALAFAHARDGRPEEARAHFAASMNAAVEGNDPNIALRSANNWALTELSYGSAAAARDILTAAMADAATAKRGRHEAWLSANAAIAAFVCGDLRGAAALADTASHAIENGMRNIVANIESVRLRVSILRGEPSAPHGPCEDVLAQASAAGDAIARSLAASALAFARAAAGDLAGAAAAAAQALGGDETPAEAPYWGVDAALRFGDARLRERARARIAAVAERDAAAAARALLAVARARDALRARRRDEAEALAADGAAGYLAVGWRLDAAFALELAGRVPEALAIFREAGAEAEVQRLTTGTRGPRRRGDAGLTTREREIASLLAAGRTARAIAEILVISERTVETHTAAIYRKLGITGRRELAEAFAPAPP